MLVGHRGIAHSLLAVVAMAFVLTFYGGIAGSVVAALSIGYVVHLAGDFVTNSGIPLLWPIKRQYRLACHHQSVRLPGEPRKGTV